MAKITLEQAITIMRAIKNEYVHPEVKEACDLAIECMQAHIKIGKAANAFLKQLKRRERHE